MIRFAIAMLIGSMLVVTSVYAQQAAPPSAEPPSQQSQVPSGPNGELSSTPVGAGETRSAPFRVCSAKDTPPRVIKSPSPEYSKQARQKNIEGTTVLSLIVGADGLPRDIRVTRPVGYGLDEEAIKAVQKWRFKPSTIDGKPVAVMINVEVAFHLR